MSRPPRRRVTAVAVALAVVGALLTGCSLGEEAAPRPVVAFLGGADPDGLHYETDAEAMRQALRADCEDCEYAAFDAEGDADTQAQQMTEVLDGGADVVVLEAVDAERGEELLADAGEVPVITMDRFVAGADYHVGFDPEQSGRVLARAAMAAGERAPGPGEGSVGALLLGAGAGDLSGRETTDLLRRVLQREGAEVLAEDTPDVATRQDAEDWTTEQVAALGVADVDLVVAASDAQAAGVVAAYDAADVAPADRPAVVGTGTDLESLRRLVGGEQAAAVHEPRDAVVQRAVTTAAEVLEDAPVTDTVDVEGVPSFLGSVEPVTVRTLTTVMVGGGEVSVEELCDGEAADACAEQGIS